MILTLLIYFTLYGVTLTKPNHMSRTREHITLDESVTDGKRVFVIGDVHGCFDDMMALLLKADVLSADRTKIADDAVVIMAGDIINKGPKNLQTLQWLSQSGAYVVPGNHEGNILTKPGNYPWVADATEEDLNYARNLPWTITIQQHNTIVVHAGLLPGVPLAEQTEFVMTRMRNLRFRDGQWIPYEETSKGENWGNLYNGPLHAIYGHDAGRGYEIQEHSHATGLDTRCVYGSELTGVFLPATNKEYVTISCQTYHHYHGDLFEDFE